MISVYFRFLKDKIWSLLIYIFSTVAFLEMYVAMFPTFGGAAQEKFDVLLQSYPKEIWTAIGVDPATLSFTKLSSFVSMEQYSLVWPIIIIILGISFANSMIAAEVEKGTIEQTLALPLQRWKIFTGRFAAAVTLFAVFVFSTIYAIVPLAKIHKINIAGMNNLPLALSGLLFGVTVFSIALLASSLFSEKSKASFLSTGIIIALYGANVVGGLKSDLSYLKDYSIFHYFNGSTNLIHGVYVENYLYFFLGVTVIFASLALVRFTLRDTSV